MVLAASLSSRLMICSGGQPRGTVRMWSTPSGSERQTLHMHPLFVDTLVHAIGREDHAMLPVIAALGDPLQSSAGCPRACAT